MRAEHEILGFDFPDWSERFDRLEEALGYVEAALSGEGHGFEGKYYSLAAVPHSPQPRTLRIIVGGSGPKRSPELAGRFADEFNIYSLPAADLRNRIQTAREAAVGAGRDPDALVISSTGAPVIGATEKEFRQRLEALAQRQGVEVDKLEESFREVAIPLGTHAQVSDLFAETRSMGISRYYVQIFGSMDLDYAAEVIEVLSQP